MCSCIHKQRLEVKDTNVSNRSAHACNPSFKERKDSILFSSYIFKQFFIQCHALPLKVHNFYLAKKSLIVSFGVDSIKFQNTISPAAGTELSTYGTPRAPCWSHTLLPTTPLWGECRETENSKESNTSFQQYRGVGALKKKSVCNESQHICREVWVGQEKDEGLSLYILFFTFSVKLAAQRNDTIVKLHQST